MAEESSRAIWIRSRINHRHLPSEILSGFISSFACSCHRTPNSPWARAARTLSREPQAAFLLFSIVSPLYTARERESAKRRRIYKEPTSRSLPGGRFASFSLMVLPARDRSPRDKVINRARRTAFKHTAAVRGLVNRRRLVMTRGLERLLVPPALLSLSLSPSLLCFSPDASSLAPRRDPISFSFSLFLLIPPVLHVPFRAKETRR